MVNSRAKGARLEREAARAIRVELGLPAERGARNGVRGAADIIGTPGLHFECKGRSSIAALRFLAQSILEAGEGEVPLVLMRQDGGPWVVMLALTDVKRFVERIS